MDARRNTNEAFTTALKCSLAAAVLFITALPAVVIH
jgi:hypothetical protein